MRATRAGGRGEWTAAVEELTRARRVAVIGCPGSGKTWLATRLAASSGLPYVGLDDHYFDRGWQIRCSPEQWQADHDALAQDAAWVMDGLHSTTLPERLNRAEAVVWLDYPTHVCVLGYLRRTARWRLTGRAPGYASAADGSVRLPPDAPSFLRFILTFRRHRRPALAELLARQGTGCAVLRLTGRHQVPGLLAALAERLPTAVPPASPARRGPAGRSGTPGG
ncbi:hypothetical protein [Streptacidiphilus neutrinimicus]|uniref:hypothetical protein n=1 Tax=Streptacidiphilus neutrinimicus TaxID=105420 RepID=UPI000693BFAD|nr:hypothetical protein [Streptacidiphilus neutrinimicus]